MQFGEKVDDLYFQKEFRLELVLGKAVRGLEPERVFYTVQRETGVRDYCWRRSQFDIIETGQRYF